MDFDGKNKTVASMRIFYSLAIQTGLIALGIAKTSTLRQTFFALTIQPRSIVSGLTKTFTHSCTIRMESL